jgi:alkylhydroperoxidase family enzyme
VSTWPGAATLDQLVGSQSTVGPAVLQLRALAASTTPGRTAAIVDARIAQMVGGTPMTIEPSGDAELAVVALVEQFLLDAHGVDDAMVAGLRHHFSDADVVAIMFHLAISDGFAKLGRAMGAPVGGES